MQHRVSDLFHLQMGKTPSRNQLGYWENGSNKWISISDLSNCSMYTAEIKEAITDCAVRETNIRLVPKNTVIMSFKLSIGKTAITSEPVYTNEAIMAFINKGEELVLPEFLYYQLLSKDWGSTGNRAVMGATLNKASLSQMKIYVPSLQEQRGIVQVLGHIDSQLKRTNESVNKLDDLVKSRFVEMFGGPREMDRWRVCDVSEITDVTVGVVVKPAQYYVAEGEGDRAFRSLNIAPMRVKSDSWVYFSKEGNEKNKKSQLRTGDVVLVRSGAPGVACVITPEFEGCNAVDVIIARLDKKRVDPVFFAAFMNYPHGQVQIVNRIGGSAQQHLNVGACKKMRFMLPPLALQHEFADFVTQVDKLRFAAQQQIDKLEMLKKSLLQEYFN